MADKLDLSDVFNNPIVLDVWDSKYRLKMPDGSSNEHTIEDSLKRVVAGVYALDPDKAAKKRAEAAVLAREFIPAGRIQAGAGTDKAVTLINCYVNEDVEDSMPGIMHALNTTALTMQQGGGVGTDFTTIRPNGAIVRRTGSVSSGILPFMDMWHAMCGTIMSSGSRRGAMMGTLADWHPDVLDFIKAKRTPGRLTNFNVSVLVSDALMQAVKEDQPWYLGFGVPRADGQHVAVLDRHPYIVDEVVARKMAGMREQEGYKFYVYAEIPARELWDTIIRSTYDYAEPGVIFVDQINKRNNLYYAEYIHCTNPCFVGSERILTQDGYTRFDAANHTLIGPSLVDGEFAERSLAWVGETARNVEIVKLTFASGQTLTCTPNHKFTTPEGMVEARDLVGKMVQRAPAYLRTNSKHADLNDTLAQAIGWFLGDGYVTHEAGAPYVVFQANATMPEEVDYVELLAQAVADASGGGVRSRTVTNNCLSIRLSAPSSRWFLETFGIPADSTCYNKAIPEAIWTASAEHQRAFLRGLYSADGTVNIGTKGRFSVRYNTVSDTLAQDLLLLWSQHGVRASLSTRPARETLLPSADRTPKLYHSAPEHRIILTGHGFRYFADNVGFLHTHKLEALSLGENAGRRADTSAPPQWEEVISVEAAGTAPIVYCANQPETNRITVGGFTVSNCGEQPLPPHNVCDLGPVNLAQLVRNPFTAEAYFDFDRLKEVAAVAVRFLDNVLDVTQYPLPEQKAEALSKRRLGVGITGLANALSMLRLRYGSPDAIQMTDSIMKALALACYRASVELAKERGPFPLFDADKYLQADFIKHLCRHDSELAGLIRKYGIRNSHLLSIAPTGTISLYSGNLSGGLEPVFSFRPSKRKVLQPDGSKKEYIVKDFGYNLYEKVHGPTDFEQLPEYMVGALDLSVEAHLLMQATCQKWVDSAISKTINCPAEMSYDDFKAVYMRAYDLGCKGCTTYRPSGIRDSVLEEIKPATSEPTKAEPALLLDRPETTEGRTYKIKWPGTPHAFYVTINHTIDASGKIVPFEVFINSKSVEHQEWIVALTRTLSAVFRRGGDVTFLVEELSQVFSPKGGFFVGKAYSPSLVAMIGRTLEQEFIRLGLIARTEPRFAVVDTDGNTAMEFTVEPEKQAIGDLCLACEQYTLIRVESCVKCTSCGHSSCG